MAIAGAAVAGRDTSSTHDGVLTRGEDTVELALSAAAAVGSCDREATPTSGTIDVFWVGTVAGNPATVGDAKTPLLGGHG
jgi:hypothetical protein